MQETIKQVADLHPSEEQIAKWKEEHGKLTTVSFPEITDSDGTTHNNVVFCFKPNIKNKIQVLSLASKHIKDGDGFAYTKIILAAYILNGKEWLQDDEFLVALTLAGVADELIKTAQAAIKKL